MLSLLVYLHYLNYSWIPPLTNQFPLPQLLLLPLTSYTAGGRSPCVGNHWARIATNLFRSRKITIAQLWWTLLWDIILLCWSRYGIFKGVFLLLVQGLITSTWHLSPWQVPVCMCSQTWHNKSIAYTQETSGTSCFSTPSTLKVEPLPHPFQLESSPWPRGRGNQRQMCACAWCGGYCCSEACWWNELQM